VLPVSEKKDLPAHLGMRHRAAIAITDQSDAITVTVSEQNGGISFCKAGELKTAISPDELRDLLQREFD